MHGIHKRRDEPGSIPLLTRAFDAGGCSESTAWSPSTRFERTTRPGSGLHFSMDKISTLIGELRGYLAEALPLEGESSLEDPRGVAEWAAKRVGYYGYGGGELAIQAGRVQNARDCYKVLADCLAALPKLAEMPEPELGEFLEPEQVANSLGVSADKVRNWCNTRQLRASNINDGNRARWIITREDLAAFLATRQPQPVATSSRNGGSSDGPY